MEKFHCNNFFRFCANANTHLHLFHTFWQFYFRIKSFLLRHFWNFIASWWCATAALLCPFHIHATAKNKVVSEDVKYSFKKLSLTSPRSSSYPYQTSQTKPTLPFLWSLSLSKKITYDQPLEHDILTNCWKKLTISDDSFFLHLAAFTI